MANPPPRDFNLEVRGPWTQAEIQAHLRPFRNSLTETTPNKSVLHFVINRVLTKVELTAAEKLSTTKDRLVTMLCVPGIEQRQWDKRFTRASRLRIMADFNSSDNRFLTPQAKEELFIVMAEEAHKQNPAEPLLKMSKAYHTTYKYCETQLLLNAEGEYLSREGFYKNNPSDYLRHDVIGRGEGHALLDPQWLDLITQLTKRWWLLYDQHKYRPSRDVPPPSVDQIIRAKYCLVHAVVSTLGRFDAGVISELQLGTPSGYGHLLCLAVTSAYCVVLVAFLRRAFNNRFAYDDAEQQQRLTSAFDVTTLQQIREGMQSDNNILFVLKSFVALHAPLEDINILSTIGHTPTHVRTDPYLGNVGRGRKEEERMKKDQENKATP